METEWAETAEDILWRRSKLGLRFAPEDAAARESLVREMAGHGHAAARGTAAAE